MGERDRARGAGWSPLVAVVTRVELALAAITLVVMFLLVLTQAAQRYLPLSGWSWTGELARFCLVWITFTAAGVLVTMDSHIALQLVDSIKNPMIVRVVRVIACGTVAIVGAAFAVEAWDLMASQGPLKSPSLRMPLAWLYVLPFLGFVSTAVRGAVAAVVVAVRDVPAPAQPNEVGPA